MRLTRPVNLYNPAAVVPPMILRWLWGSFLAPYTGSARLVPPQRNVSEAACGGGVSVGEECAVMFV